MGDADVSVVELSAQEVGAWMDEAVYVIDEGFENLYGLITDLNERTKGILRELKILKSIRRVFVALNVFIVPVIVAVLLCYGTRKSISGGESDIETIFQALVMALMLLSSSVGLPFYIFAIYESFKASRTVNGDPENSPANESHLLLDRTMLSRVTDESTLEQLNDFARQLEEFMPQIIHEDLQRMMIAETDSSEQTALPEQENTSATETESVTTDVSDSLETDGSKQDQCLDSEGKPNSGAILYEFEVCMNDQSPDLALRIELANKGKQKEATENEQMEEQHEKAEEEHEKAEEQHEKGEEHHEKGEEQHEKGEEQHEKVEEQHEKMEEQHQKVEEQQVVQDPPKRRDVATSTVEKLTYVTYINGYPEIRHMKI